MVLNQPLSSTGPVEAGSSLSQLERLMVDRLGSTALSVKPKAKDFHKSESTPTFTFTPMATTITTSSKKNEFSSSIHSKIPFKQNTQDFTKRVSNGGVQKNNYRCGYFLYLTSFSVFTWQNKFINFFFRPLMQKLYGSPKQHKGLKSSTLNNHSHSLAIQNVRIKNV